MITSRRGFLKLAGTFNAVGVTGCLGDRKRDPRPRPTADTTLFASWRGNDPTSSITLQWLTGGEQRPERKTVALSPSAGSGSARQVQAEVASFGERLYRQRAEMTGLSADTTYDINIGDNPTGSTVKTAPQTLTDPVRFAAGGDVGTSAAVSRLHNHASNWNPLFGLVGGDLAYANGRDNRPWVRFLETWHQHMRSDERLIPIVAAIGNHEVQSGLHGTPEEAPFFYTLFDNAHRDRAYWALDIGEYLSVIILDSNHTTEVSGTQTEWLSETLSERTDRSHLMATYHIPAYPSVKPIEARDREDIRQHWVPLFEQHDINGAFEHDGHAYKRTHLLRDGEPVSSNGVRYVGDGAWGKDPRDAASPAERPYLQKSASRRHVIRGTLTPGGRQRIRAVGLNGQTIDQFEL